MDKGVVLLVAGGVGLAAGLGVVAWLEGSQAGPALLMFPVSWSEEASPPASHEGFLEEGEEESFTFGVEEANVSWTETRLVWEEDSGERSTFRVNVTAPNGTVWSNETREEVVVVRAGGAPVPEERRVNATSHDAAMRSMAERFTDERGLGTWTVTVTLVEAPGQRPVPGLDVETQPDGDQDYQVQFRYGYYEAVVDPRPLG